MSQHLLLEQINSADLRDLIYFAVVEALEMNDQLQTEGSPEPPSLLTREEAAKFLRISLPSLHRRVKAGDLQPLHVGKRVLFRREDLDALVASAINMTDGGAR